MEANVKLPASVSLAGSYNPANISYLHKDGQNIRTYKLPSTGRPIYLSRPCRVCAQDHFDFEHEFLSRQPKAEAHIAQADLDLAQAYGYPTTCFEPICISDDKYTTSPDSSFALSNSSSLNDANSSGLGYSNNDCDDASRRLTSSGSPHRTDDATVSEAVGSVFLLDPDLRSRSVQPLRRRKNPDSAAVHLPPARATGSGQAFAGHIPTTVYVSLSDSDPRLSLIDTGATLSIIDEHVAQELRLFPLNGPGIQVNGVGEDRSLGYATIAFSIQGRRDGQPVHIHSSADFHVLRNFRPGVCLGLDVIRLCGVVIDVKAGRALVDKISFPIYDTRGKAMSSRSVVRAIVAKASATVEPNGHTFVPVTHHLVDNVQYTIEGSLWTTPDSKGPVAIPAAVVDSKLPGIWVTNFGDTPIDLPSDARLADAVPLAPDDVAASAGSFFVQPPQITDLTSQASKSSPPPAFVDNAESRLARSDRLSSSEPKVQSADGPRPSPNCRPRAPSSAAQVQRHKHIRRRSHSFDDYWPRTPFTFALSTSPTPTHDESHHDAAQPLDFSQDDLSGAPTLSDLESILVDGRFNVGKGPDGQPHPSVVAILCNNVDAFSLDGRPGHVSGAAMRLDLQHPESLRPEAPRRVSPDKRRVIDDSLDQLLDWDVVKPSSSPVSYPVLLVKQGPKWQFCVNYRGLNAATVADQYPLPRIDDVFHALRGNNYFSGLDAIRGYHQIDIEPSDRWKTAFVSHRGLYQYKRVPFGLKNAPAFFQRFMDHLLGHMRWTEALVYLDDVVIFSPTLTQHVKSLDTLLKAARNVGLKFSPDKCHFALSSLKLLGRRVSTQGISVLSDRAQAVRQLSPPSTLQGLCHIVGLFNYYRNFIPQYASLAAPLTELLRGHKYQTSEDGKWHLVGQDGKRVTASAVPIDWGPRQDQALTELKTALSSPPTLARGGDHDPTLTVNEQKSDPALRAIVQSTEGGHTRVGYEIQDGVLVFVGPQRTDRRLCIPGSLFPTVFAKAHDESGHFGIAKSLLRLSSVHHPRLASSLQAYIDNCPTCLRTKLGRRTGELSIERTMLASEPFHTISADLLLGLPTCRGYDSALVVVDIFSKLVLTAPCSASITAPQLFDLLSDLVLRRGWKPKVIVTDSDRRFVGTVGQAFAKRIGAKLRPSAPYHQQANPVERHIQTLQRVLRSLAVDSADNWVDLLPAAELAINSTPSLAKGQAPFDLVYITCSDTPLLPLLSQLEHEDRVAMARARLDAAWQVALRQAEEAKVRYDAKLANLPTLKLGDRVFIRLKDRPVLSVQRHSKLDPVKLGPFAVKKVLSRHRVRLELPPDLYNDDLFDASQLELAPEQPNPFNRLLDAPAIEGADGSPRFEVEAIVGQRRFRGYVQYRVKWRGDPRTTWEFEEDLLDDGCQGAIDDWLRQQQRSATAALAVDNDTLEEQPVAFISTITSPADAKLVGIELEISGLAWAIHRLQHFLEGAVKIIVVTDHAPLGAVLRSPSHSMRHFTPRIEKLRAYLMPFLDSMGFVHKAGRLHSNVDALSRLPPTDDLQKNPHASDQSS
ncbi:uncharacterized protein MEPE_01578 [Melanopsichium pennsylvanicum]|uniref:RNA-directed DNA polymerase n=1 Tax=Melanopsichium pennsylvanicum TaxID=63383 RepID=A0AAJ4XIX8_9BASI|nr:uncharacterized protein MEPE_01578 [Melanopsichium pennsylvanicum]